MNNLRKVVNTKFLNRITSVEYMVSEKCQNACKYCYRVIRHSLSDKIYSDLNVFRISIKNFKEIFNVDDDYFIQRTAELYGGDPIIEFNRFEETVEFVLNEIGHRGVVVPTNARTISSIPYKEFDSFMKKYGDKVKLSLSVDSPFQDSNRPLSKFGKMLNFEKDINYKYIFKLARQYHIGFHPMLHFDTVDQWFNTFKFFVDNGIVPYLLEVRHPTTKENILEGVKQLVMIRSYVENHLRTKLTLKQSKNFNTIYANNIPRGLSCSALTTLTITPTGDVPCCHRLLDRPFVLMNLLTKTVNYNKLINLVSGYDRRNHPKCAYCPIKNQCQGPCLGMNYEYWGTPFLVYDSLCWFNYLKFYSMSLLFNDWNREYNTLTQNQQLKLKQIVYDSFSDYNIDEYLNELRRISNEI